MIKNEYWIIYCVVNSQGENERKNTSHELRCSVLILFGIWLFSMELNAYNVRYNMAYDKRTERGLFKRKREKASTENCAHKRYPQSHKMIAHKTRRNRMPIRNVKILTGARVILTAFHRIYLVLLLLVQIFYGLLLLLWPWCQWVCMV